MFPGVEKEVHPAVVTVGLEGVWAGINRSGPGVGVSKERGPVRVDAAGVRRIVSMEI